MIVTLYPAATDLKTLETVWRSSTPARLAPEAHDLIEATAAQVRVAATGDEPVYRINNGFMIAEVTTAALMSENKHLANPCSTDSTPTLANQEDHVSLAVHAACRLKRMVGNLSVILGVEALCAVQGIEARAPLKTSEALQKAVAPLRGVVPLLRSDRYMATELKAAGGLISSDALARSGGLEVVL